MGPFFLNSSYFDRNFVPWIKSLFFLDGSKSSFSTPAHDTYVENKILFFKWFGAGSSDIDSCTKKNTSPGCFHQWRFLSLMSIFWVLCDFSFHVETIFAYLMSDSFTYYVHMICMKKCKHRPCARVTYRIIWIEGKTCFIDSNQYCMRTTNTEMYLKKSKDNFFWLRFC